MRFQVLTAASMKMTVFWDIVLYSLEHFRGAAYCLHHQGDESKSVGKLLPDYMAQIPNSYLQRICFSTQTHINQQFFPL
jgi:hypothetical protein